MSEIKRVQSAGDSSRTTGMPTGLNDHCGVRQQKPFLGAAERRVAKIPAVKGVAFGAFGEFSSSVNAPIGGFAHEGALKNPDRFGQSNYKAVCVAIHWWMKRRWIRLAVITADASRHDALRYSGGPAQRQAAT